MTRVLRDDVQAALARENSQLRRLANEWGGILFPEGDEAQFADAYAQTVTYALLLARFEGAESLRPLVAADTLQREHGLLAEAIQLLEANAVRDELNMSIELLERAIGAVDSAKVGYGGDPWLYFYEQFLGAYDPRLRKDRGVYYTPVEVVRAQVRLAGELLRTRFKKQLMFADDDVVVLDPAVGTGTYPLAVLDHAAEIVRDRLGLGAVASKLRSMADRLHAFEVLVGPYSVAHLRLSQRLREAGVTDKTANVYLTDTLESPYRQPDFTASLLQEHLTQERKRALQIKKDTRVFICLEPVFKVNSSGSEPLEHEMNHSYMNPSLRAFGQFFVVFAEPPVSAQPPKGALHDPPTGQHLKTMAVWGALDHLNQPASHGVSPIHQLSGIGAIGPDQLEPRKEPPKLAQHQLCPITVLDVRRMHHHGQQQPEGVNHDMAFASFHLLASVIATWSPFSVVFTLWLSIMAAEGVGSLPSNSRTLGRKVSWIRSQVPSFRQRRKYPHAVLHGGRSWGIIRQVQPLRSTYRMPFMTSRMSTVRGRPPGLASGIRGASSSHWTSVRSLG